MKTFVTSLVLSITLLTSNSDAMAAGRASVKVTSASTKTGSVLTFATVPSEGLKINDEGPWKLEIKSSKGAQVSTKEFKRSDWKESIAGFEVPITPEKNAKEAEISYKMITFVCTAEKTMCYREVVEDTAKVSL